MENNEMNPQTETVQENEQAAAPETAQEVAAEVNAAVTEAAPEAQVDLQDAREELKSRQIPEDVDAEVESAMAGADMGTMLKGAVSAPVTLEANAKMTVKVLKIASDNVFVEVGTAQGIVPLKQFKENPAEGSEVTVVIAKEANADGLFEANLPGNAVSNADWETLEKGMILEVTITGSNSGGLECKVKSLRGFIPMSQISSGRVENVEQFVGQKMECVITEVNQKRHNLVLSHRKVLDKERDVKRDEVFSSLEVGQIHTGTVRKIMDFGAFIDIGGVDGLLHISQLSWERVKHPSDVLKEGDEITVRIEKIDPKTKKISFAYRDMQVNPWANVEEKYPIDSTVTGKVTKIMDFGAFVELEPAVEGLVHISALSHNRVEKVTDVVNAGDEVTVKVIGIDPKKRKISLSIKALTEAPVREKREKDDKEKASSGERDFKPGKRPKASYGQLRGGRDTGAAGGLFG